MRRIIQKTVESTDQGTISEVYINGKMIQYVIEPPWRDNKPQVSCIPQGVYTCVWHTSPKYGEVYMVTEVPGRSLILKHWGNFGGDYWKGYKTNTLGCQIHGKQIGLLWNGKQMQRAVLNSRSALREFNQLLNKETFILEVDRTL
jgi:hypothetical protein